MKNLRQSITFCDFIVKLYLIILSIPLSSSNLYLVYLSLSIPHSMVDSFSIYSFTFWYESFLVISFINELDRNLLTLRLVVFNSAK